MSALLDELPSATLVTDADGLVLFANAEFLRLTARSLPSCVGAPMDSMFTAASRLFLQADIWPTLQREQRVSGVHLHVLCANDERAPVYLNGRLGIWQDTPACYWNVFAAPQRHELDAAHVLARRRAEDLQGLQAESERFTREVADLIPDAVAFWGRDLRCRFVNKAHQDWFCSGRGSEQGSSVGAHLREMLGEDLFAASEPLVAGVLGGQAQAFERSFTLPGGEQRHALIQYRPQVCEGTVAGFLTVVSDISSLKATEAALRQEAAERRLGLERLRRSSAAMNEAQRLGRIGSWYWQTQGDVVCWTDELFRMYGCKPELGAPSFAEQARLYPPEDFAQLQHKVAQALRTGEPYTLELAFVRPDGSGGWVEARGECVRDDEGRITGLQGTVQDITTRHEANQRLALQALELHRSNEELERFAYVASHDLQEPLRMVTSYGQLLKRRHLAELSPQAQEFVSHMIDGGRRAQALIGDLLSLARLDSRAQPWQPVSLNAVVAGVLRPLRLRMQETGAQITHDVLPVVVADAAQLSQLMANLLGNALKFCGQEAPRVHVGAVRQGGGWRISVRDNGIGIEPRYFERIFQMFQRLHLRTDYEGTGIGLAICKKVVERHGGHLGVESTPGQGSTFFFSLPDHGQGTVGTEPRAEPVACLPQTQP